MNLQWVSEPGACWNMDRERIVGKAADGIFDARYRELRVGAPVPGEWWRVEADNKVVGYGWLEVVWGDAEILMATATDVRGQGVGSFIVSNLIAETHRRGLNYVYNTVRHTHPDARTVMRWLEKRGFAANTDGSLVRRIANAKPPAGLAGETGDRFVLGELVIAVTLQANAATRVEWIGRGSARHGGGVQDPVIAQVVGRVSVTEAPLELHFEELESCDPAALTTLIALVQCLQDLKNRHAPISIILSDDKKWQHLLRDGLRTLNSAEKPLCFVTA